VSSKFICGRNHPVSFLLLPRLWRKQNLTVATVSANLGGGIEEDLNLRIRKYSRSDVATLHHDAACSSKGTLGNSREEQVRVEGRLYEVRIAKTDMPDTWRLMVVRATVVLDADPEMERLRGQDVAKPFMERTCKGRPYEQIIDKLQDDVNYYTLFRCTAPT